MSDGAVARPATGDGAASLLPWWERWPGRLEREVADFGSRGLPVTVVEDPRGDDRRLVLQTDVLVEGESCRVRVVYPDSFPHRRFRVASEDVSLSRHQAPGGDLCVLGRGAEFWRPSMTGAEIVAEQVPLLVRLVEDGGETLRRAEDPQGEPFTSYYPYHQRGAVLLDERFATFRPATGASGRFELATPDPPGWLDASDLRDDLSVEKFATGHGWVSRLGDEHGEDLLAPLALPGLSSMTRVAGMWVHMDELPKEMTPEGLWSAVVTAGGRRVSDWLESRSGRLALAFCGDEETQQDVREPAWVFVVRQVHVLKTKQRRGGRHQSGNPAAPTREWTAPQVVRGLRIDERSMAVRIPDMKPLRSKDVAVLGLGSIGAPIVQELVKARVGTLRLMDRDFVDPATSVRHPLGLSHAGVVKAAAMADWIGKHDAGVAVQATVHDVGSPAVADGQLTDREAMLRLLDGADLVIGATAEHDVNRYLDECAGALGVPRLYAWSQSGYGGVVALLREERTGCFHCLELLMQDRAEAGNPLVEVPPRDQGRPVGEVQGVGCADKTFAATHPDLLPISIQAAKVAQEFLAGLDTRVKDTGNDVADEADADVWAVQVRRPDGVAVPPRWESLRLPPDSRCRDCSPS